MKEDRNRICPVELADSLDSRIRKWIQDPTKILSPFIREGIKILDIGCGPGYFTIEMAKMAGKESKVFAVDIQEGMLKKLHDKIAGTELEGRIILVKNEKGKNNIPEKVDFILAFYMVHEVPDKDLLFKELKDKLKEKGQFLIVEPKLFHVSKTEFNSTLKTAEKNGFKINPGPKLPFSHSAILN
jgi:ubiquinone/menaquinone biosynthesis C-methylase UbiE